jgi:hypothetical protein
MKVCYVTEMNYKGKYPRNFPMMRTEQAWPCALEADCIPCNEIPSEKYDLAIIIIPKLGVENWIKHNVVSKVKTYASKIAIMQEGPYWCFQDYPLPHQIWYYNTLRDADLILVHNKSDKKYYQGITNHPDVRIMPTLMIEDPIDAGTLTHINDRKGVMIGGNFVSWYGGFDSFVIASSINQPILSPTMGRRQEGESQLGIKQLPYLNWSEWITALSQCKIGVHLMKTHAAGTFALNCAYLGIPCIGYKGLDTQETCHPSLSIELGDIVEGRKLINILHNDADFYSKCSNEALKNYKQYYHEDIFNSTFKKQLEVS